MALETLHRPHLRGDTGCRALAGVYVKWCAQRMKATYNRNRKPPVNFKDGELVLWKQAVTNTENVGLSRKLAYTMLDLLG